MAKAEIKAKAASGLPLDYRCGDVPKSPSPHRQQEPVAHDLTKALASEKIRCMRRCTNDDFGIHKLTDAELMQLKTKVALRCSQPAIASWCPLVLLTIIWRIGMDIASRSVCRQPSRASDLPSL
jgi:hypothetical protein